MQYDYLKITTYARRKYPEMGELIVKGDTIEIYKKIRKYSKSRTKNYIYVLLDSISLSDLLNEKYFSRDIG